MIFYTLVLNKGYSFPAENEKGIKEQNNKFGAEIPIQFCCSDLL